MHKQPAFTLSFLLLVAIISGVAQERVTVTDVSVWVKATDSKGKPVRGLKSSDFKVYEDGKEVNLTCLKN